MVARLVSATRTVNPTLTLRVGTCASRVVRDMSYDFSTRVTKDRATLPHAKLKSDRNARLARQEAASRGAADLALSVYGEAQAQIHFAQATIAQRKAAHDAAQINLG